MRHLSEIRNLSGGWLLRPFRATRRGERREAGEQSAGKFSGGATAEAMLEHLVPPGKARVGAGTSQEAGPGELDEETLLMATKLRTVLRDRATLSVCGLQRSEGVSRVTAALAKALVRQSEQRVLIIDADLDRPSQHRRFDVPVSPGLAEALLTDAGIREAVHPTSMESLYVLPAGSVGGNPNLVYSVEYFRMLATLRDQFQIILIDTPPLEDSGAGYLLASRSESVLLVMASGQHPRRELRMVSSELARLGAKVLGVCLTEMES